MVGRFVQHQKGGLHEQGSATTEVATTVYCIGLSLPSRREYMKDFTTKRDFEKLRSRAKTADLFLFIYVILQPLINSSVHIFKVSNKAKVVGGRDF